MSATTDFPTLAIVATSELLTVEMNDDARRALAELDRLRTLLDRARSTVAATLLTGEHIDHIAEIVFSYTDGEGDPTAGKVAEDILTYLVHLIAPFVSRGHGLAVSTADAELERLKESYRLLVEQCEDIKQQYRDCAGELAMLRNTQWMECPDCRGADELTP